MDPAGCWAEPLPRSLLDPLSVPERLGDDRDALAARQPHHLDIGGERAKLFVRFEVEREFDIGPVRPDHDRHLGRLIELVLVDVDPEAGASGHLVPDVDPLVLREEPPGRGLRAPARPHGPRVRGHAGRLRVRHSTLGIGGDHDPAVPQREARRARAEGVGGARPQLFGRPARVGSQLGVGVGGARREPGDLQHRQRELLVPVFGPHGRVLDPDRLRPDRQLFRHDAHEQVAHALSHLALVDEHEHPVVGGDADPGPQQIGAGQGAGLGGRPARPGQEHHGRAADGEELAPAQRHDAPPAIALPASLIAALMRG